VDWLENIVICVDIFSSYVKQYIVLFELVRFSFSRLSCVDVGLCVLVDIGLKWVLLKASKTRRGGQRRGRINVRVVRLV
jgi:hypothetical protein